MADTINIYRGVDHPANIDYDTVVGTRSGSGTIVISDQEHRPGTQYFYAARQESTLGTEEANRHVVQPVWIDADGDLIGVKPTRPLQIRAARAAGGTVKLQFRYRPGPQDRENETLAILFNVYYDQGQGRNRIDIEDGDCKLGTVTAHGRGEYSYTTGALADDTEFWFAVTAEDDAGRESKLSATVDCRADTAAATAVADLAAETVM